MPARGIFPVKVVDVARYARLAVDASSRAAAWESQSQSQLVGSRLVDEGKDYLVAGEIEGVARSPRVVANALVGLTAVRHEGRRQRRICAEDLRRSTFGLGESPG